MAFSDVLETFRVIEDEQAEADSEGSEKRVCLPKPDVNNITVLTESLPNEPILPWHHFDSPWLEKEDETDAENSQTDSAPVEGTEDGSVQQLSLELNGVEPVADAPEPAKDSLAPLIESSS
ncbi:MAG: hypothetical protein HC929_10540 [Leptolyngbyaceae cyanobacterium SM2_5_2]|nr:hypothetical protein [Leptolyngbyaceae cyanobacterium SM2_5_2]